MSRIRLSLQEQQTVALNILKRIDNICKANDIHYWGMWGTLIGAVRHHGFIPWDDDLDLAMKRDEYERFLNLFREKKYIDGLYLDNALTSKQYPFYISRVCDDNYLYEFEGFCYTSGAFVDIYPFDGVGNDNDIKYWKDIEKNIHHLKKGINASRHKGLLYGGSMLHKIANVPFVINAKIHGNTYFFNKLDEISKKYTWKESKYVNCIGGTSKLYWLDKEWFDKTVELPFEDTVIPSPYKYDLLLRSIYGDYMHLPPENSRKPSHGFSAYKR